MDQNSSDSLGNAYSTRGMKGYWQARLELANATAKKERVTPEAVAIVYAHLGQMDVGFE